MIAETKVRNGYPREPRTIDFSLGKKRGYSADIYSGVSFEQKKTWLTKQTIDLSVRSGLWTHETARKMVEIGMEEGVARDPSMIFFRRSLDPIGTRYIGVCWQEIYDIPIVRGSAMEEISTLYIRLRAFDRLHRRRQLGRTAVQLAVAMAPEEIEVIAHRTGSEIPAWAFMQTGVTEENPSGIFVPGELYPWDKWRITPAEKLGYRVNPVMQQVMVALHFRVRVNGEEVDMTTGVSKHDYPEANKANDLDPTHAPTMKLRRIMREDFGMEEKDSILACGFRFIR